MCVYWKVSLCEDLKTGTVNDPHNSEASDCRAVDSEIENDSFQCLLCSQQLHDVSFLVHEVGTLVHTYIPRLLGRTLKRRASVVQT